VSPCLPHTRTHTQAHGTSNLVSGLLLGLQNYMAYSTSALYYKTGGGGRLSSVLIAALIIGFLLMGPGAITYFPRPLAGSLLVHIGGCPPPATSTTNPITPGSTTHPSPRLPAAAAP
jgi:hypothetical protein